MHSAVQVATTTPTQAVLVYDAPPSGTACRVEISESPAYSPVVPDVDPILFPGSDQDSRQGVVSNASQRIFVAGKHGMNANSLSNLFLASDGRRHSRALLAGTAHYYRITCDTTILTGSFTTPATPLGVTYGEVAPVDGTRPGAYNWPDLDAANRSERTVDPVTGNLVRKVTVPADTDPFVSAWPPSGATSLCSHVPMPSGGSTYYLCSAPSSLSGTLVSIDTATGDVLPLTSLTVPYRAIGNDATLPCSQPVFDAAVGTQLYCIANVNGKTSLLMGEWTGPITTASSGFTAMSPNAALRWTNLTPAPNDLPTLLGNFDPAYTPAQQANIGYFDMVGQQRGKVVMRVWPKQDASGWIVVFDPGNKQAAGSGGTGGVVAALPLWKAPASRWCGLHNSLGSGDNTPWVSVIPNHLNQGGTYLGGPYRVSVSGPGGGITPSDTVFTINPQSGLYEPVGPDPVSANGYLQDAQPGDLFYLDANGDGSFTYGVDEYIELISKDPATHTWSVRRANQMSSSPFYAGTGLQLWTTTAISANAGTLLYAACRTVPLSVVASGTLWWNFEADPHGKTIVLPATDGNTSPQVIEQSHTGGHMVTRDSQDAMADAGCFNPGDACWTAWTQTGGVPGLLTAGPAVHAAATPSFEGARAPGGANVYQQHPSYEQVNAPAAEKSWLFDRLPLVWGTGAYGTSQLVSGTTTVYKVAGATLHRELLGTLATCGTSILRDASSPATGTRISDATPYTYCVARKQGECLPDAAAGDVYVSCPGAPSPTAQCLGWTLWGGKVDICVGDVWAYAQSVVQAGFSSSQPNGELNRIITQGFSHYHEQGSEYDNARATPDGAWAMFYSTVTGSGQAYLAKVPPQPLTAGTTRYDGFIPVTLALNPPSGIGVDNAVVEFGYLEDGGPSDYFCTSRQETCVKGSQPGNTYGWASDAVAGQPCGSGCSIAVPLLPGRLAYFRAKYRDAANNVLQIGETGIVAESGASVLEAPAAAPASPPAPVLTAPTLTGITPASGAKKSSVAVILTGTNFVSGATVKVASPDIAVSDVTVASPTQISAVFTTAAGAAVGATQVTVSTPGGTSSAVAFKVVSRGSKAIGYGNVAGNGNHLPTLAPGGTLYVRGWAADADRGAPVRVCGSSD